MDGIIGNIIYEFLGDYWHGNPALYPAETKILNSTMTCGESYKNTWKRFGILKRLGYSIKYIWESDWKRWSKNKQGLVPLQEYIG